MKYTSRTTAYVCPGIQFVSTNPCPVIVVIVIVVFLIDRNCCFRKKQRCWYRRLFYLCKSHWAKTTWISEMKGHMIFKVAMSCHCWIEVFFRQILIHEHQMWWEAHYLSFLLIITNPCLFTNRSASSLLHQENITGQ